MDIEPQLDIYEQDTDTRPAVGQVRAYCRAIDATAQYRDTQETRQLKADITSRTVTAAADDIRARLAEEARNSADIIDARDDDERSRLENMNGEHVDPSRFTLAQTPAEISVLLNDALMLDADTARKAWGFAAPVLRMMASREAREHRLPHSSSAFSIWTTWGARMATLTQQAPTRQVLSDRATRRQREVKDKILSVWKLVGLDHAVARHLLVADVQERSGDNGVAAKGGLQVGRYFDQIKSR